MRYLQGLAATVAACALAGCVTTPGTLQQSKSMFDNANTVSVTPAPTWCGMRMTPCIQLGATWVSNTPKLIGFNVQIMGRYTSLEHVELRIDGKPIKLADPAIPTSYSNIDPGSPYSQLLRQSDQVFMAPLSVAEAIATAQDVRIRVYTSDSYDDAVIVDAQHRSKAFDALEKLLTQVGQRDATAQQ